MPAEPSIQSRVASTQASATISRPCDVGGRRPVAYFDGPGGTQVPRAGGRGHGGLSFHHNANTHWAFPTSAETDAVVAAARGPWPIF